MKILKVILANLFLLNTMLCAEDVTLITNTNTNSAYAPSEILVLNQGDTAKCVFSYCNTPNQVFMEFTTNSVIYEIIAPTNAVIAGPATIRIKAYNAGGNKGIATFSITRAGLASPPAAIPQEAGTTWNVILESSSDLINWTPTNPGEYGGTEPKRFFRTRMVKKEQP
jgi:hypothetical protein